MQQLPLGNDLAHCGEKSKVNIAQSAKLESAGGMKRGRESGNPNRTVTLHASETYSGNRTGFQGLPWTVMVQITLHTARGSKRGSCKLSIFAV